MSASGTTGGSPSFRSVVVLGVVAVLLLLAVGGLRSYRELAAARQREAGLEARLGEARAGIEVLAKRIERLRSDPAAIEKLARDQLMMTGVGEVVIVYPREVIPPLPPAEPLPPGAPPTP